MPVCLLVRLYVYLSVYVCVYAYLCACLFVSRGSLWNVAVDCIVVGGDFYNRLLIGMLANGGMQT